ncbi:MAG TPA: TPM domain-containing protein [Frankiaceae bacterium]|jgi:uncharacterized protein|nr:TPM domain-containing protein [Frankiaceae bacterium]
MTPDQEGVRMRLRLLTAATLVLGVSLATPAWAAGPSCKGLPAHANVPVVDAANVLDAQKRAYLTGDLMRLAMTSDIAVVAATVPDLGGDDVSSYARRLLDCWGVGDADSDRGVLVLVAMRERRVRVELGAGLAGEVDETELDGAVAAMTAPMRAGNVAGALRAASAKVAEAVGATLPDLERFVATNGKDGLDNIGIPPAIFDTPRGSVPDLDPEDVPSGANPFKDSPIGDGSWIPKVAVGVIVLGIVLTLGRALLGGVRGALSGGSTWRGGFPMFGGSRSGWSDPNLLNNGQWSQGTWVGGSGSAPLSSSSSIGSASSASSSSGSGFGGGSGGGGGASGSW